MENPMPDPNSLIRKIHALPAERVAEVEDFVDFIAARAQDRAMVNAVTAMSLPALSEVWNNSDDDAYNSL